MITPKSYSMSAVLFFAVLPFALLSLRDAELSSALSLLDGFIKPVVAQETPEPEHLNGLSSRERSAFAAGLDEFGESQSVRGTEPGADDPGLGPRFNSNSCLSCHAHPMAGGTSPRQNPLFEIASRYGATNAMPFFLRPDGPILEPRFKFRPDGKRDGAVHQMFVITGRRDAAGCNLTQPDFNAERNNIAFRIPSPVFGAGLIEAIPDEAIETNLLQNQPEKRRLGISGHTSTDDDDRTVKRFGWKAQDKSLANFSADAYNNEQGVTSEIAPHEIRKQPGFDQCLFNQTPEDVPDLNADSGLDGIPDILKFATFMRFLAPLKPTSEEAKVENFDPNAPAPTGSVMKGAQLFRTVGCAECHTPTLRTGDSVFKALRNQDAHLFSDLALHKMGPKLADDIVQGKAEFDEFRTAPLWGVGRRLFFLHDGRSSDLNDAIHQHASGNTPCSEQQERLPNGEVCASEANSVIQAYNALSPAERESIINFLKTL